jgi:hypothetical protein
MSNIVVCKSSLSHSPPPVFTLFQADGMSIYSPTTAFRLNRKNARRRSDLARAKVLRELRVGKLRDLVDHLLRVLAVAEADDVGTITAEAIRVTGRDFVEQLDGADELVRAGAMVPARVVGRTCIELAGVVRYLTLKNDERISAALFLKGF